MANHRQPTKCEHALSSVSLNRKEKRCRCGSQKPHLTLLKRVDGVTTYVLSIDGYEIPLHPATYTYLKTHKKGDYEEVIAKAVNVGLTAAQQGRIANALNAVNNELKGEFALLEQFMETQQALFDETAKRKRTQSSCCEIGSGTRR